ncbi:hypothetical protein MMO38_13380 [Acinetobacter sp. NIPH 1852]|nr:MULTISPECIES: hypothetical protein [unclassified Acinetobacter]ENU32047.1 hypothetical protein F991_00029 [Acinetobacter sp. CIP-A165]MCH7309116.1 hypothetical protein [Acinetobacter sp. NIPH 1852]MDR7017284.1 hypothetical protein [Prolinoborus sp. 3657]
MRNTFLALLTSSIFLLSACNENDNGDNNNTTPNPKPPTSDCTIHCAP